MTNDFDDKRDSAQTIGELHRQAVRQASRGRIRRAIGTALLGLGLWLVAYMMLVMAFALGGG